MNQEQLNIVTLTLSCIALVSSIYSAFDMHNYCLPNSPIVSLFTKTVAGHTGALFPVKRAS
ncbi:hypothetical protein ACXI0C_25250 [Klebsiella quasipneumoniae]